MTLEKGRAQIQSASELRSGRRSVLGERLDNRHPHPIAEGINRILDQRRQVGSHGGRHGAIVTFLEPPRRS